MTRLSFRPAVSRGWLVLVLAAVFAGAIHDASLGTRSVGPGRDAGAQTARRPNILLAIADDWSFPHAGVSGDWTPGCVKPAIRG